nr:MAG: capsid protein [Cressdnaviricota sp.]
MPRAIIKRKKSHPYGRMALHGIASGLTNYAYNNARRAGKYVARKAHSYLTGKNKRSSSKGNSFKKGETKIKDAQQDVSQHNDMSTKTLYIRLRKRKIRDKAATKFKYIHTYQSIVQGLEGLQGVSSAHAVLTSAAFVSSTATRGDPINIGAKIFDMNPNARVTGSAIVATGTNPDQFINVERVCQVITVWNMEPVANNTFILWCIPVADTKIAPDAWWTSCIAAETLGVPIDSFAATANVLTAGFGSVGSIFHYGLYPTMSPAFKKLWKIVRVHKVTLQGGDQRSVKMCIDVNKTYNLNEVQNQFNNSEFYMKGTTVVPMIVTRSGLVRTLDGGVKNVTFGVNELGITCREEYVFSTKKGPPVAPITYSFYGTVGTGVGATEHIINDVDADLPVFQL